MSPLPSTPGRFLSDSSGKPETDNGLAPSEKAPGDGEGVGGQEKSPICEKGGKSGGYHEEPSGEEKGEGDLVDEGNGTGVEETVICATGTLFARTGKR